MFDLDAIRRDTAGCEAVIHLNNAGASLPPRQVVDAMVDYLREEEKTGGYETYEARLEQLNTFYDHTAQLLGCERSEIAFTQSASDAWWRAFSSIPLVKGQRVLVGRSEFQANAFGWLQARERGVEVDVVPNTAAGDFDLDVFDSMLDDRVALVSLTMISMSNGAVHPAAQVGSRLADHPAIYLLDACQAAGQLPLDVNALGCDFLMYTGRKFMRGPRGTGVLYARAEVLSKLGPAQFVDGRSANWINEDSYEFAPGAQRFELGETGFAAKAGLAEATRYVNNVGIEAIAARIALLADHLRDGLAGLAETRVLDEGTHKSGIVTFNVDGHDAMDVQGHLRDHQINLSAPDRSNARLDMGSRGIDRLLRAGVHYFNTEDELDRTIEVLSEL